MRFVDFAWGAAITFTGTVLALIVYFELLEGEIG